ncbi:putative glycoside hydrolase [Paenibacillus sp.]|uniref:putative glycoside hydrolase n=1 Tax=Paenibacillus sp. TaxID=58172 RepID=UPI0028126249|nr:putative glycoside hydrolase [Paenibacillus sp.]
MIKSRPWLICLLLLALVAAGCANGSSTDPLQDRPLNAASIGSDVRPGGSGVQHPLPNVEPKANAETKKAELADQPTTETRKPNEAPQTKAHAVLPEKKRRADVKGVYVSPHALHGKRWRKIEKLLKGTELNTLVIDVKSDYGKLTYPSRIDAVKEIDADGSAKIGDLASYLTPLKKNDTYLIARIVTFKDPYLAAKKPEWAMKRKDGSVWRDKRGVSWVDPYNEQVWEYNIRIAEEAISAGFDEVQFDYVRFPEQVGTVDREVSFRNPGNETKDQIIQRFLRTATRRVHEAGGFTSADVFGLTTTAKDGMGIGQKWELLAQEVDAISPMVYPSHYAKGSYGVQHPDLKPYKIVKEAIADAKSRNEALARNREQAAALRPWLQDFTAKWVKPHQTYRRAEVQEQIQALKELGIRQYLLWNPSSNYSF